MSNKAKPARRIGGVLTKSVTIFNPLPQTKMGELMEAVDYYPPATDPDDFAFTLDYIWAAGSAEQELLRIEPGEKVEGIQAKTAVNLVGTSLKDKGLVLLEEGADERRAAIDGLTRALNFYRERGTTQIRKYRRVHGLTKEEMEFHKVDTAPYFLNEAKADAIEEELKRLRTTKKGGRPKKVDTTTE